MEKLTIKNIYKNTESYIGKTVTIEGWAKTVRDSRTFGFLELNDGSFFKNIQIVFDDHLSNFNDICKLSISSSLKVTGTLVETKGAKQPFEIKADQIEVYNVSDNDYPLQKKETHI